MPGSGRKRKYRTRTGPPAVTRLRAACCVAWPFSKEKNEAKPPIEGQQAHGVPGNARAALAGRGVELPLCRALACVGAGALRLRLPAAVRSLYVCCIDLRSIPRHSTRRRPSISSDGCFRLFFFFWGFWFFVAGARALPPDPTAPRTGHRQHVRTNVRPASGSGSTSTAL